MASRAALLVVLFTTLSVGCAPATRHARATPARPPDPDRWARAACLRGEYPPELDARAYATARQQDLAAARRGLAPASATARLAEGRAAFDARCATWLEQAQVAAVVPAERSAP